MKERPILMSAPMIRALLAGTKTQTRRVMKRQKQHDFTDYTLFGQQGHSTDSWKAIEHAPDWPDGKEDQCVCPYASRRGDRLWVRESWMPDAPRNGEWADTAFYGCGMSPLSDIPECYRHPWHCLYRATWESCALVGWKPSIHMPRWASRILLEVTELRVQRLQDISEEDARAEGCAPAWLDADDNETVHAHAQPTYRQGYARLWRDIHGAGSWEANPWVWVVEFKRIQP